MTRYIEFKVDVMGLSMSVVIIFGLGVSNILTFGFVPVLYVIFFSTDTKKLSIWLERLHIVRVS